MGRPLRPASKAFRGVGVKGATRQAVLGGIMFAAASGMARGTDVGTLRGVRILLVEDADDVREAMRLLLGGEGAEVAAAATAEAAAARAAREVFDVLLTDLGLPDISGETLIGQVLATSPARPRIVVVTGCGEPHATRARAAGADVVLTKPVDWARLLAELRRVPAAARRATLAA